MRRGMQQQARQSERKREPAVREEKNEETKRNYFKKTKALRPLLFCCVTLLQSHKTKTLSLSLSIVFIAHARTLARTRPTRKGGGGGGYTKLSRVTEEVLK